jgi:hypothetical protein
MNDATAQASPVIGTLTGIWAASPDLLKEEKWDVVTALASRLFDLVGRLRSSDDKSEASAPPTN